MSKKEKLISRLKTYPKDITSQAPPKKNTLRVSGKTINRNFGTGGIDLKNTMEYKGYVGSVEFSESDELFFGKVLGIRALISYEGSNAKELIEDFHGAVDAYLEMCQEMEALHGVSAALLTIYDMCKAIDKRMVIKEIHLVEKHGGKSGDFYY